METASHTYYPGDFYHFSEEMRAKPTFVDSSCWASRTCTVCNKGCRGRHGGKYCCTCYWSRVRQRAVNETLYTCSECKDTLAREYSKEQARQEERITEAKRSESRLTQLATKYEATNTTPPTRRPKTCGHNWCILQIDTCCTCTDRRNKPGQQYQIYVDGIGFTEGNRFDNYCTACRADPNPFLAAASDATALSTPASLTSAPATLAEPTNAAPAPAPALALPTSSSPKPAPNAAGALHQKTRADTDKETVRHPTGPEGTRHPYESAQSPFKKLCGHRCYYYTRAPGSSTGQVGIARSCCACLSGARRAMARSQPGVLPANVDFCKACHARVAQKLHVTAVDEAAVTKPRSVVPSAPLISGVVGASRPVDLSQLGLCQPEQSSSQVPIAASPMSQSAAEMEAPDVETSSASHTDFDLVSAVDDSSTADDFSMVDELDELDSLDGMSAFSWEDIEEPE